jgi:hypothetical protein
MSTERSLLRPLEGEGQPAGGDTLLPVEDHQRRDVVVVFRDERSEEYPRYSKRAIDNYRQMGLGDSMIEYLDTIYRLDPEWCELFMQYTRAGLYTREVVPQSTREIWTGSEHPGRNSTVASMRNGHREPHGLVASRFSDSEPLMLGRRASA